MIVRANGADARRFKARSEGGADMADCRRDRNLSAPVLRGVKIGTDRNVRASVAHNPTSATGGFLKNPCVDLQPFAKKSRAYIAKIVVVYVVSGRFSILVFHEAILPILSNNKRG